MNMRNMRAFPSQEGPFNHETGRTAYAPEFGLTIRAYFSAKAMQGILAHVDIASASSTFYGDHVAIAKKAVECADALCDALGMKEDDTGEWPPF